MHYIFGFVGSGIFGLEGDGIFFFFLHFTTACIEMDDPGLVGIVVLAIVFVTNASKNEQVYTVGSGV